MFEVSIILFYIVCGVLAAGMHNHHLRYTYHSLFIEKYWSDFVDTKDKNYMLLTTMFVNIITGPIGLIMCFLARQNKGLSYRLSNWTREEAMVLFPDDYMWGMKK